MPPSPAAPATAAAAPRDAAGAARREAVRAWNGARDLDEIPARVWARWRGAALARAGVRFAGGDGAGRPDFELAACAKVAHTDAARRWALTWRLCATAVAGSRVRVEFVATVVDEVSIAASSALRFRSYLCGAQTWPLRLGCSSALARGCARCGRVGSLRNCSFAPAMRLVRPVCGWSRFRKNPPPTSAASAVKNLCAHSPIPHEAGKTGGCFCAGHRRRLTQPSKQ